MDAWHGLRHLLGRITAAAKKFAGKFRAKSEPHLWPNLAPAEPTPADPAEHAVHFANRWVDRVENFVEGRMHVLDIPEHQVGSSDHKHGVAWRTFFPHEGNGGSVGTGGRINVDSGVLNPELLTKDYGEKAGRVWAKSRLRDKVDAVIIHEFSEAEAGTHEAALAAGLRTERPISDGARRILRAMEEGWRGRG